MGLVQHTFHWKGAFGYGVHLDSDNFLALGYSNGLRGYPLYAFTGDKKLLASVEDRIFLKKKVLGLVALGLLIFWDSGYVWQEEQAIDLADMRHDVGVGVRGSVPAMSNSNVVNLTWGFPLGWGASPLDDSVFTLVVSSSFD